MQHYIELINSSYNNEREARAVFYRYMEDKYELSRVDLCLGGLGKLDEKQIDELQRDVERLAKGEPVQYVTGFEWFHSMRFNVKEGVLIPRPETEELVDWILHDISNDGLFAPKILDIGCGSGAISVALAHESDADVTAWDISDTALQLTRDNALLNDCCVKVVRQDALNAPIADNALWDIIVSNPPYICNCESIAMDDNVLQYEPHVALFVDDDDPLLFYRKIADYALQALCSSGRLYFEINERFGSETLAMLHEKGFKATLRNDQFDKPRMISASLC